MREIKFRTWDIENKKYIYDSKEDFYLTLESGLVKYSGMAYDFYFEIKEKFIIEQFTGLHDKNGKEIYEGDVVSDGKEQGSHCVSGKHVVKFEKGGFFPFAIAGWEGTMSIEDCEIIGDIHQNPELISGE